MARIRTIKPEFPQSESMGRVSRDSRLCFIQLWTLADDEGRLRGNSRMLASLLFPYDDDAPGLIDGWLMELERQDSIQRYMIDGTSYVQVTEWTKHQKIDKPSPSKIPTVPAEYMLTSQKSVDEASRILAKAIESSSGDQGSRIKDQGRDLDQGSKKATPPAWLTTADLIADGLTQETAEGFIAHRKAKKAKLTALAWKGFMNEVAKADGWTNEAAALKAIARNWTSVEADWLMGSGSVKGATGTGHTNRQKAVEDSNRAVGRAWASKGGDHAGQ